MAVGTRGVPRFLPTLTEVVHAPPPGDPPPDPEAERAALALRIRSEVQTRLEALLPQIVTDVLLAQVDTILARLKDEMEPLLREAVEQALQDETLPRQRN